VEYKCNVSAGCREKGFLQANDILVTEKYLEAVAIPRAIGSLNLSLSRVACTKFAPTRPVTTTTAAVRDGLAPVCAEKKIFKDATKVQSNIIQILECPF
jgi:hypothetical protein